MTTTKKFTLVGVDGNAFSILGYVRNAMRESGFSKSDRIAYTNYATSGDYNHLLTVSINMINKCNERYGKNK